MDGLALSGGGLGDIGMDLSGIKRPRPDCWKLVRLGKHR
jgi:hypothetical protein